MPRKGPIRPRPITPDPVYSSVLAQRFINRLMLDGKKSVAERIFYAAMELLEQRSKRPALEMFELAVRNIMPVIEVRPRRVGGSTYQVPVEVRPERKVALALRWAVINARKRAGRWRALHSRSSLSSASAPLRPPDGTGQERKVVTTTAR